MSAFELRRDVPTGGDDAVAVVRQIRKDQDFLVAGHAIPIIAESAALTRGVWSRSRL